MSVVVVPVEVRGLKERPRPEVEKGKGPRPDVSEGRPTIITLMTWLRQREDRGNDVFFFCSNYYSLEKYAAPVLLPPLFFFFFSRFAYIEIAECLVGNSVEYAPTLCETRGNCPSKAQIFLLQSWQGEEFEEFEETFFPRE